MKNWFSQKKTHLNKSLHILMLFFSFLDQILQLPQTVLIVLSVALLCFNLNLNFMLVALWSKTLFCNLP